MSGKLYFCSVVNIHIAIIHFLSPEKNTFNLSFTKQSLSVEFQLLGSDNKGGNFEKKKKCFRIMNFRAQILEANAFSSSYSPHFMVRKLRYEKIYSKPARMQPRSFVQWLLMNIENFANYSFVMSSQELFISTLDLPPLISIQISYLKLMSSHFFIILSIKEVFRE